MNTLTDTSTWVCIGVKQGAKWGLLLSVAYVFYMAFGIFIGSLSLLPQLIVEWLSNSPDPSFTPEAYFNFLRANVSLTPMILIVGTIFTLFPALGIGGLSGGVLGCILSRPAIAPSTKSRLIVGVGFGVLVALVIDVIVYLPFMDGSDPDMYSGLVVLPSIVYIGACLILSYRIAALVERTYAKETLVIPLPVRPT